MPTASVNGTSLYYETSGSGAALTLVMGLGCSARMWRWMEPLLTRHFRVLLFDNRGAGRSGKPDGAYTTELFADDLQALLETLHISTTHLLGASVGGMIAQRFALKYPRSVERLVLGCTMPNFFHLPPQPEALEQLQKSLQDSDLMMPLFVSERFISASPDRAEQLRNLLLQDQREQGQDAFFNQLSAAMEHDTLSELSRISAPTMVLCGDDDPMAPVENSRFLAQAIPRSTLTELPGIRHAFWVEGCEDACAKICGFLAKPSCEAAGGPGMQ